MQQTEKYQFNLIESSDAFSAQPLNDNMEKVETALDAADAAVAAHRTEVNTALANHRTEVNTALSTHRTQVNTALSAQAADTAARLAQQPRIDIVTWTGDGQGTRTITFPFQPKAVILAPTYDPHVETTALIYGQDGMMCFIGNNSHTFNLTWSGNSLTIEREYYATPPEYLYNAQGEQNFAIVFG